MQHRELSTQNHVKTPLSLSETLARPLRLLMQGFIDYAGLFPPAELALPVVAATYAAHRAGPHAWMLGHLIVPFAQLAPLGDLLPATLLGAPWRMSVVVNRDPATSIAAITAQDGRFGDNLLVKSIELRADNVDAILALAGSVPSWLTTYIEIPLEPDPRPLIEAIAAAGLRAKVRTGGITAEAFPSSLSLVRFLAACTAAGVPFKATAGLHHPLRGVYPLTYEAGSPRAPMFGYLNLLLATAALRCGADAASAIALLEERDPATMRVGEDEIAWRDQRWSRETLRAVRHTGLVAIGSCSFYEPVEELIALYGAP